MLCNGSLINTATELRLMVIWRLGTNWNLHLKAWLFSIPLIVVLRSWASAILANFKSLSG